VGDGVGDGRLNWRAAESRAGGREAGLELTDTVGSSASGVEMLEVGVPTGPSAPVSPMIVESFAACQALTA
jgi:hypothetical protein